MPGAANTLQWEVPIIMRALDPDVFNAVWAAVEPILPAPDQTHPLGCHRPRIPDRVCFRGILIRLVTGCSWVDVEAILDWEVSDTTLRARRDEQHLVRSDVTARPLVDAGSPAPGRAGGRRSILRPIAAADHDWLYQLLVVSAGARWKFRGRTPNPSEFQAELWAGVHAQFVVCDVQRVPIGLVGLYNSNLVAGHTRLFAVAAPGRGIEVTAALGELGTWAFEEFELNKVWIEATEFNLDQFAGISRFATVEGRLCNHEYWRGRFWDLVLMSISAEVWSTEIRPRLERPGRPQQHQRQSAGLNRAALEAQVEELWPVDSLAAVELLTWIEEICDICLDGSVLGDLDLSDPGAFAGQLFDRLVALAGESSSDAER